MKNKSLHKIILRLMFFSAALPILILGIYAYVSEIDVYSKEVDTSANDSLMTIQAVIDDFDTTSRSLVKVIADSIKVMNTATDTIHYEEIGKEMRRFETQFTQIERIYLVLNDGQVIDKEGIVNKLHEQNDLRTSIAYKSALALPNKVVLSTNSQTFQKSDSPFLSYSMAVIHPDSNKVLAVIVVDINPEKLEIILSGIHLRIDGTLVVSDGAGNIIFGQYTPLRYKLRKSPEDVKQLIEMKSSEQINLYNEDYKIYGNRGLKTGWYILSIIPVSELKTLQKNMLISVIVVIVIMLIAVMWLSSRIQTYATKPIDKLVDIIGKFGLTEQIDSIVFSENTPNELVVISHTLNQMIERIRGQGDELIQVLSNAIEANDEYTKGHCERVTKISLRIGEIIGMSSSELNDLALAAMLHDIGKLGVPSNILNKADKLTDEEFEIMKLHPKIGSQIVSGVSSLAKATEVIHQHHEKFDGTGYPMGLKGENILLMARILCISDSFDAMTTRRSYRMTPLSMDRVRQELINGKGTQFDPELVDIFMDLVESKEDEEAL